MTRKPDHRGVTARAAILREMLRRHDARLSPATSRELADAAGLTPGPGWMHLRTLAASGLIARNPKQHGGYVLTADGLDAAKRGLTD